MRDEGFLLSIRARISAIEAEIECAKMDNRMRESEGHKTFNFNPEWFQEKARELNCISEEIFRY